MHDYPTSVQHRIVSSPGNEVTLDVEKVINEIDDIEFIRDIKAQKKINATFKKPGEVPGTEFTTEKEMNILTSRIISDFLNKNKLIRAHILPSLLHWYGYNTQVTSVLQGFGRPRCGLVALSMAGKILAKHSHLIKQRNDTELLKVARKLGFSKMGEILSAYQMAELAAVSLNCSSVVIEEKISKCTHIIIKHIAKGYPILVPYDNDRNYEPCLRKGHNAHWALITGAVYASTLDVRHCKRNFVKCMNGVNLLANCKQSDLESKSIVSPSVYVFAKQGKSAKLQLWSLDKLSESNANLFEKNPRKDWTSYIVSELGIKMLCEKFVLLYPCQESVNLQ